MATITSLNRYPRRHGVLARKVNLMPGPSDRAIFIGRSGSGKTTAAVYLMRKMLPYRRIVILDAKGEDALLLPDHLLVDRLRDVEQFPRSSYRCLVYRPDGEELADPKTLDAFCDWSYRCGGFLTYLDEVSALGATVRPGAGFLNLLARGRARHRNGVKVHSPLWMATQRPRHIPAQCYTESNYVYMFHLSYELDRDQVAAFTDKAFEENPQDRYGFRFYDVNNAASLEFGPMPIR